MSINLASMDTDSMSPEEREAILVVTAYRALREKSHRYPILRTVLLEYINSNVARDINGKAIAAQNLQTLKEKLNLETLDLKQLERAIEFIREKGVGIDVAKCEICNDTGRLDDANKSNNASLKPISFCTCSSGGPAFWEYLAKNPRTIVEYRKP